jgi:hypothetical protein
MRAVAATPAQRATPDLAAVFLRYGEPYRQTHPLSGPQQRAVEAIEACRTAALGGHLHHCDSCGHEHPSYNSCRNRHCPRCQHLAKARWLAARQAELLPVSYCHAVFTLPHEINGVSAANPRAVLGQLFHSVSASLAAFARNELGGTLGFVTVLHTWNQLLRRHLHLHCLIAAGALALDHGRWIPTPQNDFLFRVEPLGIKFRGHFLAHLETLYAQRRLVFPGNLAPLASPRGFAELLDRLYAKTWLPYLKPPLAGPPQVLDYLARYSHRVALSNERILAIDDTDHVHWRYRDRADGDTVKTARIPATRFIGRFLQHVLPHRFRRIRYYGFWSNRAKPHALPRCRKLLGLPPKPAASPPKSTRQWILELTGVDIQRCPACGQLTLQRVAVLLPAGAKPVGTPRIRAPPPAQAASDALDPRPPAS